MVTRAELQAGLQGAWRLAHLDAAGMTLIDRTAGGFWKSFQAVILICAVPTVLTVLLTVPAAKVVQSGWPAIFLVEAIAFVVRLTIFPLAMSPFCHWLDRDRHFVGFIVAYNWISILQTFLYMAALLLAMLVPGGNILVLIALLASMAYEWFTVGVALEVSALPATTIVLLDFVLTLIVNKVTEGLY